MILNFTFLIISVIASYSVFINSNFISKKLKIIDLPKKNSIHKIPIPKTGGIIILTILFIEFSITSLNDFRVSDLIEFFIIFIIFIIGLIDDIIDLKPIIRIILLTLFSLLLIKSNEIFLITDLNFKNFYNTDIYLKEFATIFTIFCIIVFCNSFNFIDGINGLAISLGILWILLIPIDIIEKILIVTSLLFILINNLKNKIFLGNSGSLLLSFYIAIKFIEYYNKTEFLSADQIFICFLIPGLDLVRLFFERIFNKRSPFSGDLNHFHHLIFRYFSSTNKSLVFYLFLVSTSIAISFLSEIKSLYIVIFNFILYFIILSYFKRKLK
tara:strand:- start:53797 stop:54777 length:981 start_codon:yes stop_codon:yes gene_type:complete